MARRPEQTLAKLSAAVKRTEEVALTRGIWPEGARLKAEGAALYATGRVWNLEGRPIRILPPSRKHYLWKVKNGLLPTRGNMTGTLHKAYASPQSFVKNQHGFTISVPRANFMATLPGKPASPGRRGRKARRTFLNRYFRHHNAKKAFGRIGKLGALQRARLRRAGMSAIDAHLAMNLRDAMKIKGGIRLVKLRLGKLGLEGF